MTDQLNLANLWPEFTAITGWPQTAEQLSAIFVGILLAVAITFFLISLGYLFQALKRVRWLLKLLKNETSTSVVSNRQELIEKAQKVTHDGGHLWLEFDETLIEAERADGIHLHNTLDASYFFNAASLANGITHSRMLAAVPGFLTALGVIGTFIGLQLGLSELNIGNNTEIEEMKNGLAHVISGASIAFMTSVWGVFLSVVFNFIEKVLERWARWRISNLQNRVDRLFPRLSAECQLQRIAQDGEQTRESLQGMAERIGEKMQESLLEATAGIQAGLESSLEKIMAPAINKLVDETSDGNQKALESLVETFLAKFSEQGTQQGQAMNEASAKVNDAIDGLNTTMSAFINKLEASQNASGEREKELVSTISLQVSQLVDQSNEQKRILTEFVEQQLNGLSDQFNQRQAAAERREQEFSDSMSKQLTELIEITNNQNKQMSGFIESQLSGLSNQFMEREKLSAERDQQRSQTFIEQTNAMKAGTDTLLQRVNDGFKTQLESADQIISQGKALQSSVESSVHASAQATESMKASAMELRSASENMNVFGSHIREAGNQLSGAVTSAVDSTKDLAQQNQLSSERMEKLREQLVSDITEFNRVTENIQSLLNSANTTFTQMKDHQNAYLSGLNANVDELSKNMTKLLTDYASQANAQTERHLGVWANHTTQYAQQMNNAAQALSGVVDEIEVKLGR